MKYFWLIFLLPLFSGCDKYVDKVKYVDKIVFKKIPAQTPYGTSWDENNGDPDLFFEFISQSSIKEKRYSFSIEDVAQAELPYTYIFTDNDFPLLAKDWDFTLSEDDGSNYGYQNNQSMVYTNFNTEGDENPIKLDTYDNTYEIELYYKEK